MNDDETSMPLPEPRVVVVSKFTAKHHRVSLRRFPGWLFFRIETETLNFTQDKCAPFGLVEFVVLSATTWPDAVRLVEHIAGFFDDAELVQLALAALNKGVGEIAGEVLPASDPTAEPVQN